MAIATGTATLIAAAAAAGGQVYGSKKAASANKEATQVQAQSNAEALAFAREQEARRQKEYDAQIAAERAQWEAEQKRLAPYRQASLGILGQAADRIGVNIGDIAGYSGGYTPSGPSTYGQDSGRRLDPVSSSLASLADGTVPGALTPETAQIEAPRLTLADLARMRTAGDWRSRRAF